ncbi:FkbM family methyltransferase [Pseudoalteromonas luteoviolacea]|uniref:FkbM family methyltransferase n=1 Tax=Pseudoalteromonas luteoviolacea TaxID=43657 RepID=UPI001B3A0384|nr:FkbM family methyltransferase [Pseudoalteromonas luteoviolacea]MBQ4879362.1 FkbM family methyltransferase [Pseudoalteromonas luteoviolacea]MBQ4908422.1 FkbM family methyltransferase [Pseudoalteromonas luteoviolacea]
MEYIIYGAGGNGKAVFDAMSKQGDKVLFFIDLYSNEKDYKGVPIFKPDEVSPSEHPVLISLSCLSHVVKAQMIEKGFQNCYDLNKVMSEFSHIFNHFYDEAHKQILQQSEIQYAEQLNALNAKLANAQSKDCLARIRAFRQKPSHTTYLKNDWETQYFPKELMSKGLIKSPLKMIDCGAFNGDTLQLAVNITKKYNIEFDSIVCFEPDPKNYDKLQSRLRGTDTQYPRVFTQPAGVWSKNTRLGFSSCGDQSKIIEDTTSECNSLQVAKIDDICFGLAPNYIKMDVEGAEIEALKGASDIIRQYKPNLAISVYHEPEHLWQIAELIEQLHSDYQFYLHSHGDFCNEIVLYAIAE